MTEPQTDGDDRQRIEGLLERHLPAFRRFLGRRAARVVLDNESVDDLAQSVCREVLNQLEDGRLELRSEPEFKQWLFEAGQHKLRSRRRFYLAGKRDAGRPGAPIGPLDSEDPGVEPHVSTTPSRLVATEEAKALVRAAIGSLPERDASVLRLVVLEGLSHADAAKRLDVDTAHCRVLLSRAMVKLAKRLPPDSGAD